MPRGSGRRPKPTALKKLGGNAGKRKLNDAEPMTRLGEPAMPDGLSPLAIEKWKLLVPQLLALGVLEPSDGDALASLCTAYSHAYEAEQSIQRLGTTLEEVVLDKVTNKRIGYKYKANPDIRHWNDATKIMKQFEVEFGLTPAARSRIRIDKPKEADPFEAYLQKGTAQQKRVN